MRYTRCAALTTALLLAPVALLAQDVIYRPLNTQEDLQFLSAGNILATWDHVYVGPSTAAITSGDPTIPQMTLYSVDFAQAVSAGQTWTANVTDLGAATSDANLSNTQLYAGTGDTGTDGLVRYQQASYLASLFGSWSDYVQGGSDPLTYSYNGSDLSFLTQQQAYSGIAAAIWSVMNAQFPTNPLLGVDVPALAMGMAAPFLNLAALQYSNFSLNNWYVFTDTNQPGVQEFLVNAVDPAAPGPSPDVVTTVTPEPQTYVLLLSGLLLIFGVSRMRRREVEGRRA